MSNNTTAPVRQPVITPDNHGAYVTITAALMMVLSLLFYIFRLTIRFGFGYFGSDDALLTASTAFMIFQVVAIMVGISGGLGRHVKALTSTQIMQTEISAYSADLLYILTLALAKMSASQLNARLTRKKQHVTTCRLISVVIAAWGFASMLGVGLGCHPSKPWDLVDRCSDLPTAWSIISVISILLEALLIATPAYIIWGMQLSVYSKIVVLAAFAFRLPLAPLTGIRLMYLMNARNSTDYTFDVIPATVFAQVEMQYALLAATIPCLRPFLKALNSGYLATEAVQVDRTLMPNKEGSSGSRSRSESVPLEERARSRASIRSPNPQSAQPSPAPNFSKPRLRIDSVPPQLPSPISENDSELVLEDFTTRVTQDEIAVDTISRSNSAASDPASYSSYGSERVIVKNQTQYVVHFDSNV